MTAVWINTMESKNSAAEENNTLLFKYARDGEVEKMREILGTSAPLGTDTVGTTALHCAVVGNQLKVCDMLIRGGISVDVKTKVDRTPLHLAAYYGHEQIAKRLLEKNCQVDPVDMLMMTPLHWAVQKRFYSMVKLLLMYGADPEAVSKFNKTPRTIAQSEGFVELVYLMDNFNKEDDENLTISYVFQVKPECEEEDVAGETMSIFEVDDDEEEEEGEDDGVEVIPAADCNSIDISLDEPPPPPEDQSKAVAQDSDESISNLHETINKLGNIRGLKQTDATTLKMLQSIGIQMTEDQDPTIISNVLQSGRRIILSEAGKYILNQTRSSDKLNLSSATNQQNVPMASSTPVNSKSMGSPQKRSMAKTQQSIVLPPQSPTSLVRVINPAHQFESNSMEDRKPLDLDSGEPVARKKLRGSSETLRKNMRKDLEKVQKMQPLESSSSPVDFDEISIEPDDGSLGADESESVIVPLNRIQKMEKQILLLRRENQQLRNKLELSVRLIEDNMRRLDRLEDGKRD